MQYVKISVSLPNCSDLERDTLIYYLSEAGCDSFETDESASMLYAYISKTLLNPESLKETLSGYTYTVEDMEDRDWNEEWERSGFTPIVIDNRCVICGSNHTDLPDVDCCVTISVASGCLTWAAAPLCLAYWPQCVAPLRLTV